MFKNLIIRIAIAIAVHYNAVCQIAINEVMAAPIGDEPEWIELYNYSDTDFEFDGFTISDAKATKDLPNFTLEADSYALITKDTAALLSKRNIPDNAVLVETSLPILNNTWDAVVLKDSTRATPDSLYYDMKWGEKGYSLERIDYMLTALDEENLAQCKAPNGATPAMRNSVAIPEFDLAIEIVKQNEDKIDFLIKNTGRKELESADLKLFIDTNRDGTIQKNEKYFEEKLKVDGDCEISYTIAELQEHIDSPGSYIFLAVCHSEEDMRDENDSVSGSFFIPYPAGTIRFNEIMFDVDDEHAEYVELYNTSEHTVNLANWTFNDAAANEPHKYLVIEDNDFRIETDSLAVIAWDSLIFENFSYLAEEEYDVYITNSSVNLNKTGDDIYLRDPAGSVNDSCTYSEDWHHESFISTKNVSLEKISVNLASMLPDSWTSCADETGGTPGKMNSAFREIDKEGKLTAAPNPFSPYGQHSEQNCVISYKLPYRISNMSAYIYDTAGNLLRELAVADISASEGSLVWDGRNDEGYRLPVGPYVFMLEAVDADSKDVHVEKIMLVIGK